MTQKYEYDDCTVCGGQVTEKLVEKITTAKGRIIAVVKDVPAGVCEQCGERYYRAEVVEHLEALVHNVGSARNNISIPITRYAA